MKPAMRKNTTRSKAKPSAKAQRSAVAMSVIDPTATLAVPMFEFVPATAAEDMLVDVDSDAEVSDETYATQLFAAVDLLPPPMIATRPSGATQPLPVIPAAATAVAALTQEIAMKESVIAAAPSVALVPTATATTPPAASNAVCAAVLLPAQCLMRDANELKTRLLERVNDVIAVQIDASELERIDTTALQVLLAFARDRQQQQRAVEWLGANDILIDSANLLGLASMLNLPVVSVAA